MSLPVPLRLDRLQQGLFGALGDAFPAPPAGPTLSWGYGEQSFETASDGGLISLTVIAGPSPFIRNGRRLTPIHDTQSIRVTVDSVVADKRYSIRLNGYTFTYDATGADTVTTIRDGLLGALNADETTGYATSSSVSFGADSIDIAQASPGGLWELSLHGPLSSSNRVDSGTAGFVTGDQQVVVGIQCFSKGREPRNGASALMGVIEAALQTESVVNKLRNFGIGVGAKGPINDISAVAAGHWSTRTAFDVTLYMRAAWSETVSTIETVEGTITTSQPSTSNPF